MFLDWEVIIATHNKTKLVINTNDFLKRMVILTIIRLITLSMSQAWLFQGDPMGAIPSPLRLVIPSCPGNATIPYWLRVNHVWCSTACCPLSTEDKCEDYRREQQAVPFCRDKGRSFWRDTKLDPESSWHWIPISQSFCAHKPSLGPLFFTEEGPKNNPVWAGITNQHRLV